jgi:hypothetical protein
MCFLDMQMFRQSRTKHISMCIKNIKKLNTCDLEKSKITKFRRVFVVKFVFEWLAKYQGCLDLTFY